MKEYKCIACGEVKQSTERCMCPICGYMMYELPNERKSVLIGEITDFVRAIINQKIDIKSVDFGKLDSDIHRFPDYDKIKNHRRAFYYGKTKETGTSSTNDRRKKKYHPPAP